MKFATVMIALAAAVFAAPIAETENTRVGIADCPYCKTEAEVEAFNKARAVLNKKRETENARVGIADCPYC